MNRTIILIIAFAAIASASRLFNAKLDSHWDAFKSNHGKLYEDEEEVVR